MMPVRAPLLLVCSLLLSIHAHAQFSLDREPPGPSTRRTGLVITEIMYNPRLLPGHSTNVTREFIEVFNSKPWSEDLGGFSIDGSVEYIFPANTILPAGGYLAIARVPELVRTNYGITNVLGPWVGAETNGLPDEEGIVQLRNAQGAVLLEINYEDSPPWPETADGTGHSLSLARPSYGEDDFRAWAESDTVGGSPGRADPLTMDPLASVVINEWQNHSDPSDWVELYNHSNVEVDLSGAWLSDDPRTNKFRIAEGTRILPRGFLVWDQNQLGFELFAGGETIFFWNSNQTRVIDVIDFRGQSNNVSTGRWPDGGPYHYTMSSRTPGAPNNTPLRYGVVINELMYNPISGNTDDEYIELHNRSSSPANLNEWEFVVGIDYTVPAITMAPGSFLVLAKNPTNLMSIYTNLTPANTLGPYDGTLANGGERIILAAADFDIVTRSNMTMQEKLPVPVSDLIYGDGGKWGQWSDGLGSSLELIDPQADVHHPSNWGDSNDSGESLWTAIEYNGPLGESLGDLVNDRIIIGLQGIGECLVDEVEVRVDGGPNLVANGGFENGLDGWSLQGSHDFSTAETGGFASGASLHLRAGSRGDNQSNRILSPPFASPIPSNATSVSIRAKVRWLRGHPEILLRLHGSATEAYGRLALPRRLGTPGVVNSRRVTNAGPAITAVKHSPLLPAASQSVVVTAMANDSNPINALNVRYRIDPDPDYTNIPMADNGTGGDAIANDGVFSATIPGQGTGTIVAFYIEGRDNQGAIGTFPQNVFPEPTFTRCWPNDAVARECVVRWGEVQMPGEFATYHLWVTAANSNRWHTRDTQNNTPMDGTFVYNNTRVIYNALPLYSGSPWHRTNATAGPAGPYRVDYEMNFPDDEPLLGSTDFVLNNPGNPNIFEISDLSAIAEHVVYRIFEGMGMPHNHRRYIHFFVNGSQRSTAYERSGNFIFEDSQQPNGDMAAQWFPANPGGQLFKVEDWFEFDHNGFDITANDDADLARKTVIINGEPTFLPGSYRYKFRKRSVDVGASANDYSMIYALIDAVSPPEDPNSATIDPERLGAIADWEQWMRHFAIQRIVGNWDSYGWERGKNDYLYGTLAGGFVHMPWDIDYSLGLGRPPNEPLFASNDPRITAMFNTPSIARAYWRAFEELVSGPFTRAFLDPFIDTRVAALTTNNVNIDLTAVEAIKTYISDRRSFVQGQLAAVDAPFAVDVPLAFSTVNNLLVISGSAPVRVKWITINGGVYPITWTGVTNFVLRLVLESGMNAITLGGIDRFGTPVEGASLIINAEYTGPVAEPVGALLISEVLYATPVSGEQFIEVANITPFNFDLSGWRMEGANFTFPLGSIITNNQTIVLARNRRQFNAVYPAAPVYAEIPANLSATEQVLALVKPLAESNKLIDAVRYESVPPWPEVTNQVALQLIDPLADNSRPGNWGSDPVAKATPGAQNSIGAPVPPYDELWLNEAQVSSLVGPLDNMGEAEPWLELHNSGDIAISLDGYFLSDDFYGAVNTWPFPLGITIYPDEYLRLWMDGEPEETTEGHMHTTLRLADNGRMALVRTINAEPQITDYLRWNLPGPNVSYGSSPDGQSIYRFTLHNPSPGGTNVEPPLRLFVNEWLARNASGYRDPADDALVDWFEIYNAESRPVDIGGFYLTDDAFTPRKYRIPTTGRYTIPARGFLLVIADNQADQNSGARPELHVPFALSGGFGDVGLFAPDGVTPVDVVTYYDQIQDVSEGRYSDGASTRYFMTKPTPRGRNSVTNWNSRPLFSPVTNRVVLPGQRVVSTTRALDPDAPPQTLTYTLVNGPTNSGIVPGAFFWQVPASQPPGNQIVTLHVTDNGTPPLSDTVTFVLTVAAIGDRTLEVGPIIESLATVSGQATFTIQTTPGRTYRVFYKDELSAPEWTQYGPDFVAANATASITQSSPASARFFIVQQVN